MRGDIWKATEDFDTLADLADQVSGDARDWVCIWPIAGLRWFEIPIPRPHPPIPLPVLNWILYPMALKCALADVSNLVARAPKVVEGGEEAVKMEVDPSVADGYLNPLRVFVNPNKDWEQSPDAAEYLKTTSRQGGSPIPSAIFAGQSDSNLTLGNKPGTKVFRTDDIFTVADEKRNDQNSPGHAINKIGPPKCWFTINAKVRVIGCHTTTWAADFAKRVLRRGFEDDSSYAYGVKRVLWGQPHQVKRRKRWIISESPVMMRFQDYLKPNDPNHTVWKKDLKGLYALTNEWIQYEGTQ
jgi:hypothetical protein